MCSRKEADTKKVKVTVWKEAKDEAKKVKDKAKKEVKDEVKKEVKDEVKKEGPLQGLLFLYADEEAVLSNVRFFVVNVWFFVVNVRFFEDIRI